MRLGRQNRYGGRGVGLRQRASFGSSSPASTFSFPADFGVFGLGDVGRVYLDGESSDKWHAAAGGGIWASFLDRANTVSLAVASSSVRTALYFSVGFGF